MPVYVQQAPSGEGGIERCVLCHKPTTLWWGRGCAPLCQPCSDNAWHGLLVKVSKREHLGPVPSGSTNRCPSS